RDHIALNSIRQRISTCNGCGNRDPLIYAWSRRLLLAQLELSVTPGTRVASFEAHLARMKGLEAQAAAHYRERRISDMERMEAEFHRLEAESWLAREKSGLKGGRPPGPWSLAAQNL